MIAVDVMGGDHAPQAVLQGAVAAAIKGIPVQLFGPEAVMLPWLAQHAPAWATLPLTLIATTEVITMDEDPVFAVRRKPQSSLVRAVASVAAGDCVGVLSAGNSGAMMAACAVLLGRQDGVERPAIAGYLPTQIGKVLALDLGANTECRPQHLVRFAHLGSDHVRQNQGIARPRIGLLSNGHEPGKGSALGKEVFGLLQAETMLNFVGNVEPYHIFAGHVDVVVCDGFSGNVMLKTMEALADLVRAWYPELGQDLEKRLEQQQAGGALLLGVKGTALVCHGSADAAIIERAITFVWNVSARNKGLPGNEAHKSIVSG